MFLLEERFGIRVAFGSDGGGGNGPGSRGRGFSTNDRVRALDSYLGKDVGNVNGRAIASGVALGAVGGAIAGSRGGPAGVVVGVVGGAIAGSGGGVTVRGNSWGGSHR